MAKEVDDTEPVLGTCRKASFDEGEAIKKINNIEDVLRRFEEAFHKQQEKLNKEPGLKAEVIEKINNIEDVLRRFEEDLRKQQEELKTERDLKGEAIKKINNIENVLRRFEEALGKQQELNTELGLKAEAIINNTEDVLRRFEEEFETEQNSRKQYEGLLSEEKTSRKQCEDLLSGCQKALETQNEEAKENRRLALVQLGNAWTWEKRHGQLLTKVRSIKSDLPLGEGEKESLFGFAFITPEFLFVLLVLTILLNFVGAIILELPDRPSTRLSCISAFCSVLSAVLTMLRIACYNRDWNLKLCGLKFFCAAIQFILCTVTLVRCLQEFDVLWSLRVGALLVSFVLNLTSAYKDYFEDSQLAGKVDEVVKYEENMVKQIKSKGM